MLAWPLLDLTSACLKGSVKTASYLKKCTNQTAIPCPEDIYKAHTITRFQTHEHFISYYSLEETESTSLPRRRELSSTISLHWSRWVGEGWHPSGRARARLEWKSLHFPGHCLKCPAPYPTHATCFLLSRWLPALP